MFHSDTGLTGNARNSLAKSPLLPNRFVAPGISRQSVGTDPYEQEVLLFSTPMVVEDIPGLGPIC